jgi:uncharacterized membrane protein
MKLEWMQPYVGRIIGSSTGCLLGLVYLFFGLFHMFIFGLLLFAGYYIGKKKDEAVDLKHVLAQILPERFKGFNDKNSSF